MASVALGYFDYLALGHFLITHIPMPYFCMRHVQVGGMTLKQKAEVLT